MSAAFMVALFLVFVLGFVLDASLNPTYDAAADVTTLGGTHQADLDLLRDSSAVRAEEVGVGNVKVSIPIVNAAWFNTILRILTWDLSFFEGYLNIIRLLFFGITFAVTGMLVRDYGPVMVAIAEFMGRTMGAVVGGIGSLAASILRLR